MIYKGKWLMNVSSREQEAYERQGFIVWNPKATDFCTEEQLIKMGMVGIYVNPLQPNAIFPSIEDLKMEFLKK